MGPPRGQVSLKVGLLGQGHQSLEWQHREGLQRPPKPACSGQGEPLSRPFLLRITRRCNHRERLGRAALCVVLPMPMFDSPTFEAIVFRKRAHRGSWKWSEHSGSL